MSNPLLQINDLQMVFDTESGTVQAVAGLSFHINKGETLGVVGESGCGKSVTALSILRLVSGRIASGSIKFEDVDILKLSDKKMQKIRGNDISMIFQEPMTSLNPVYTIGYQIAEAISAHQRIKRKDAMEKTVEMLRQVGIPDSARRVNEYPHQMSGGMKQRVMIAMALSCNPKLLIADEPTTALDVTIQAQIIEIMKELKAKRDMGIMFITHNLGIVADMADRVIVMYAGLIVEESPVGPLFEKPLHPYTEGLLASVPRLDTSKVPLYVIKGTVPNPLKMPDGCRFHPRCPYKGPRCSEKEPSLVNLSDGRKVRCWRYMEVN